MLDLVAGVLDTNVKLLEPILHNFDSTKLVKPSLPSSQPRPTFLAYKPTPGLPTFIVCPLSPTAYVLTSFPRLVPDIASFSIRF